MSFLWQARGSDVRPGVAWCSWVSAAAPVSFAWQAQHLVLPSGSCTTWRRTGARVSATVPVICVAGAALGALQGVGCTPWRVFCAQRLVLSSGSDVRPGVALLLLGLRRCAGVICMGGAALGQMYALASSWWSSVWQAQQQPPTTNQPPPTTNHQPPPIVRSCVW